MSRKRFSIIIISFILFPIMLSSIASAWGPAVHTYITDEVLSDTKGSAILDLCASSQACREAFMAGSEIPDITVVYYFENNGQHYRATHNWNFQENIMAQADKNIPHEVAFAYGVAQHLISDSIAHQDVVPTSIMLNNVPNWLLHPLLEQKYDSYVKESHPYLTEKSKHMFDAIIYGPYGKRYIDMVTNALPSGSESINVREHVIKLAAAFGSFYKEGGAFVPENVGIFGLYPFITSCADVISPYTSISGVEGINAALQKTLDQNYNTFTTGWGAKNSFIPHGFDDLRTADDDSGLIFSITFGIYVLSIFIIPILAYLYFKRLIVIPVTLCILIIGLLSWLAMIYLSL
jgi:hypothetical protein